MKHTVEMDVENQIAIVRYHGEVRIEHSVRLLHQIVNTPGWTPQCNRVIVYDDGLLGELDPDAFAVVHDQLAEAYRRRYGTATTASAHVCADPMKKSVVQYWVSYALANYPADVEIFSTVDAARAWVLQKRGAKAVAAGLPTNRSQHSA